MRLQKKLILFLLLFVLISFFKSAKADDFKCIPFVDIKEEYNDNIFLDNKSTKNIEKDFITTTSIGLKLHNRTEKINTGLSVRLDKLIYSDNSNLNDINKDYNGNFNYQLTPKTSMAANAGYKKDSRRDRDINITDNETEATGLMLDNLTRTRHICGFSSRTMLNEITAISSSYSFTKNDFEEKEENDVRMNIINLEFTHNLKFIDELALGRLNIGYTKYNYLDSETIIPVQFNPFVTGRSYYFNGSETDSYSATIGVSRDINEIFNIFVNLGGRYTKSKSRTRRLIKREDTVLYDSGNIQYTNNSSGLIAQAAAAYTGELTNISLDFYHDIRGSSGSSGTTERTSVGLKLSRRFTYELKGSLSIKYSISKAGKGEFSSEGVDEKTWSIRPSIKYNFTNNLFIEAAYYFINIKDCEENTDANRNQVFIKISMDYPLFE